MAKNHKRRPIRTSPGATRSDFLKASPQDHAAFVVGFLKAIPERDFFHIVALAAQRRGIAPSGLVDAMRNLDGPEAS